MPATTFLFYDLETTGRSPAFDQIVQFAAIRVNTAFSEIERYQYFIHLNPDVIPDPQAMITHRLPLETIQAGLNEYEAAQKIFHILNTPNTINIGYNNLNFDDEFLRFTFYRNLLPPYTHQFAQGCRRADMLPITLVYYLFYPEVLNWPLIDNQPSLKLEMLKEANQLAEGTAHNAMVDVEATVNLARRLKTQDAMWAYLLESFDKKTERERIAKLPIAIEPQFRQALLVDTYCRKRNAYQWPVLGLGTHYHYKNQTLWLRLDEPDFHDVSEPKQAWVFNKKSGETGLLLPAVDRFLSHLSRERQHLWHHNLRFLKENPEFLAQIQHYFCDYTYPKYPHVDADASLYINGFPTPEQEKLCEQFHQASIKEKYQLIHQMTDPNLLDRSMRIMARHYPDMLTHEELSTFYAYLHALYQSNQQAMPINHKGEPRRSVNDALAAIERLEAATLDSEQREVLKALRHYLVQFELYRSK